MPGPSSVFMIYAGERLVQSLDISGPIVEALMENQSEGYGEDWEGNEPIGKSKVMVSATGYIDTAAGLWESARRRQALQMTGAAPMLLGYDGRVVGESAQYLPEMFPPTIAPGLSRQGLQRVDVEWTSETQAAVQHPAILGVADLGGAAGISAIVDRGAAAVAPTAYRWIVAQSLLDAGSAATRVFTLQTTGDITPPIVWVDVTTLTPAGSQILAADLDAAELALVDRYLSIAWPAPVGADATGELTSAALETN